MTGVFVGDTTAVGDTRHSPCLLWRKAATTGELKSQKHESTIAIPPYPYLMIIFSFYSWDILPDVCTMYVEGEELSGFKVTHNPCSESET